MNTDFIDALHELKVKKALAKKSYLKLSKQH